MLCDYHLFTCQITGNNTLHLCCFSECDSLGSINAESMGAVESRPVITKVLLSPCTGLSDVGQVTLALCVFVGATLWQKLLAWLVRDF